MFHNGEGSEPAMLRRAMAVGLLVLFSSALLMGVAKGDDVVLSVSPAGADSNQVDVAPPVHTLAQAWERLPEIAAAQPGADVRVVLEGGTYFIEKPLEIQRRHVPKRGSLTFAARENTRPVVSGGRRIVGWSVSDEGTTWSAAVPELAGGLWRFRELFVDGVRRPRARHPNEGFVRIERAFDDKRTGFTFHANDLPESWTGGGELLFLHDWSTSRIPVRAVDHSVRRLTVAFPIGNRADHYRIDHFEPHPRYRVEAHRSFLDVAGEWFLNDEGVLTYLPLPGEDPKMTAVIAPLAEALLVVTGDEQGPVRRVHVEGIWFEHCAWQIPQQGYAESQAAAYELRDHTPAGSRGFVPAAIRFERAEDCAITRCRVAHLGTSGIQFGGLTQRCRLEDCVLEDISGNGVQLGEDSGRRVGGRAWWQAAPQEAAQGHQVRYNRIERCGQQFLGAVAVWVGLARAMEISHNEIAHHPYTGVSLGWMWNSTPTPAGANIVAQNHIHHVMQLLSDGGGIYTLGRQPGTRLVENVIHDVPVNLGRAESNGMFLDEGSDQIEIAGNTIYAIDRSPLRFHKAEQLTVQGNVLVVPAAETPAVRYNNTPPEHIRLIDNQVLPQADFDASTVSFPPTGPRP